MQCCNAPTMNVPLARADFLAGWDLKLVLSEPWLRAGYFVEPVYSD